MERTRMRYSWLLLGAVAATLLPSLFTQLSSQTPVVRPTDENVLREYAGVYQWTQSGFVYLQLWSEFAGTNQLVAFEESGEVRTLYPTDRDHFFAGPGAGVATEIESSIDFRRDRDGRIASLTWRRGSAAARIAKRAETEKREHVRFANGDIQLDGTLISPSAGTKHPAIILVHGSGPEDREYMLPFAHFLVRRGITVLGYDKRGVGRSTGDWRTASFQDLAADVVAAFGYLKTRREIDSSQVGLLGWSQGGWIVPLAVTHAKGIAFLISVSGAGLPPAATTVDEARNEMTARGMQPAVVEQVLGLMRLQYDFARTGQGWDEYAAARDKLVRRLGRAPDTFPGTPDDSYWAFIRRLYFYDPAPTLRQLQVPTLALFGELDNNIVADRNAAAWDSALKASGNRDYTLQILPRANHLMLEAKVGSNAEMPSLQRFVPAYFTTIEGWLANRIRDFSAAP